MNEIEIYQASLEKRVVTGFEANYGPNYSIASFAVPSFNNYTLSAARRYLNHGTAPKAFEDQSWIIFPTADAAIQFIETEYNKKMELIRSVVTFIIFKSTTMRYFLIGALYWNNTNDYEFKASVNLMVSETFPTKDEAFEFAQNMSFSKCTGLTSISEISKEDAKRFLY